ncbi:MAG TPA: site-specific integrase [Thermomicrobiaceae bacterium]|nr:site-specific integrase [Thermomicrobiaceae bacterium]
MPPKEHRRGRGEGSIHQRESDGRWTGALDLGYRGGKRRRRYVYGATRDEVAKKLRKLASDHDTGRALFSDRQKLGDYLADWLADTVEPSAAPRTYESYEMICRVHLTPALGRIPLGKLTPRDVQRFLNDARDQGRSPRSVAYYRAVLRKALNDAISWGLIERNPAEPVSPPRQRKPKKRYLMPDEAERLAGAVAEDPLGPLVMTTLGLGLRMGEVLGLRWRDIDHEARTVDLRTQLQRVKGQGLVLSPLKSENAEATVPLPDIVVDALKAQRKRLAELRLKAGPVWQDHDLVFPSTIGTPRDPNNLERAWRKLAERVGLDWLNFHGLRHGFGSLLAARKVHPRVAMQQMRHSQLSLTMEIYTHVAPELAREAAAEIDRALGKRDTGS